MCYFHNGSHFWLLNFIDNIYRDIERYGENYIISFGKQCNVLKNSEILESMPKGRQCMHIFLFLWFPFSNWLYLKFDPTLNNVTYSLLVAGEPSFCRDETAPLSPSGFCDRCHRTGGTRSTAARQAVRLNGAGTPHLSEPKMKSGRVPSLPRNRSHSTWTWVSVFCTGQSAAAGPVWARLSEEMRRSSVSVCKQSRTHIHRSWKTPSLQRSQFTDRPPIQWPCRSQLPPGWWWGEFRLVTSAFPGSSRSCTRTFLLSPGQPRLNNHLSHEVIN